MRGIKFWGKMVINDLFFRVDNHILKPEEAYELSCQDHEVDQYGQGASIDLNQESTYDEVICEDYDSTWIYEDLNKEGEE